ncbi:homoserine O-acetyltransferase/O-succinyltransferase family protein [Rhodopila sp.]|uniref:homoserine O-acetyltransferase/O-succinyltransferase family protein n=1 Tax=Rhodopila sp. TaxID=2480087 RepID=UPI003D121EC8
MLTIGLLNNMAPAALPGTERQFDRILSQAAKGVHFELRRFRLAGARPLNYETIDELWASELDGLIVTGTEPKASALSDEPFWPALTKTIEWATRRTSSVIWSCLAAHAAVLYLDSVERKSQRAKIFGLFDSVKLTEHALMQNVQASWRVPHSRWNDLPEKELVTSGYTLLTHSGEAGADIFCKRFEKSLFVFVQSHPEYEPATLLREYRRDVARYASGQTATAPDLPKNYFDRQFALQLQRAEAANYSEWDNIEIRNEWEPFAVEFYHNWLNYLLTMQNEKLSMVSA